MRFFSVLVSFLLLGGVTSAQQADSLMIRRMADEILLHGKAYDNLRALTKQIGGRLSGSPQMVCAEQWGLQVMKESGAEEAWLQACQVPHWVRGGRDAATAYYGKSARPLAVLALGNSRGTGTRPVRARVIEVDSFEDLERKRDSIRGKIVFYNYPFNPTFISTFQAYGDAVRYRGQGASRAAKYGAVAVIIRSMSHSVDNYPHTGAMYYDSAYAMIPAAALGLRDADWLSQQLRLGPVSVSLRTNGHFLPDTTGHNVIGELRGSEFPDQYITVGGHLDSWDPAEGAQDDGAGVVQTLEVLRTLRALGYRPRHSIRFVLFANEENGLRGGLKYAQEARDRKEKHLFALESDAGGFTPRGFGFDATDSQMVRIRTWGPLLAPYGGGNLTQGGDGADIGPLHRLGAVTAGLNPDSQRYFDYHHAASDVLENVNKRELELGAINMAALIYLVDKYGL
ncbi:MAG TPA: M20/M25/M40 family metallo-hydrolase [Chitinophagaceae bacterium]|nr:M20/M25/M40 family metallo-hydrolase [Chitinophagaceae bacterium]